MAVGSDTLPDFFPIKGVRLAGTAAHLSHTPRLDLSLIDLRASPALNVAMLSTQNRFRAAPVEIAERHLATAVPHFLLINTASANAGMGKQGLQDAVRSCDAVAKHFATTRQAVLPFSTGVIGEPLPLHNICQAIAAGQLDHGHEAGWVEVAHAILTTDTRAKGVSLQFDYEGQTISLSGVAKGSGMICPNMATTLAFVATDLAVAQPCLRALLHEAAAESFNCITVDGDTSTNDAVVLISSGAQQALPSVSQDHAPLLHAFRAALKTLMQQLAQAVVRDGEGASKLITVQVAEAQSVDEAQVVARTIAHSLLVKTALHAGDANWGRLLAAIGRAPITSPLLDVAGVALDIGGVAVVRAGQKADDYDEGRCSAVLAGDDIRIEVRLGRGASQAQMWTTDLSAEYVKINAEYRS